MNVESILYIAWLYCINAKQEQTGFFLLCEQYP